MRAALKQLGVRAGRFALFLPAVLKPRPAALRAQLWGLHRGVKPPELPAAGMVSLPVPADWPDGFAAELGWVNAGPVLLRLDVAEQVAADLSWAARSAPVPLPAGLAPRLSVKADVLPVVLRCLGFRLIPSVSLPDGHFGPPAPVMIALRRRRVEVGEALPPRLDSPFAALGGLFGEKIRGRR